MSVPARPARGGRTRSQAMGGRRLVVLARWPAPGRCKRRLAVELGDAVAARVQQRLTGHGLVAARLACRATAAELVLATSGLGARSARRWGLREGADRVVPQGHGSLALRLRRQVVLARRDGVRQLVLIGSDLPELAPTDLEDAFRALDHGAPVVLGPATDGGYWLIGLGSRQAATPAVRSGLRLFAGASAPIDWGGAAVLQQTLQAAAVEGLGVTLLSHHSDLDRPVDLARWR